MSDEILIFSEKRFDPDGNLFAIVIWKVPVDGRHPEGLKYRAVFIPRGRRMRAVLYDNHHPKGHHKHLEGLETAYEFTNIFALIKDFEADVGAYKAAQNNQDASPHV